MSWLHNWDDIRLFLAIAESGSLSQAARRLNWGQPTVSRRLVELEEEIGATLFERSLKGTVLSPAGESCLQAAKQMAEAANEWHLRSTDPNQEPNGCVRITAPPLFCLSLLPQFAMSLRKSHPRIQIQAGSHVKYLELSHGEADIAVRTRPSSSADQINFSSFKFRNSIYLNRSVAKKFKSNQKLEDLPWIAWDDEHAHLPPNPQLKSLIKDFTPSFTTNEASVMLSAAEAGLGGIVLPEIVAQHLRKTSLIPLDISLGQWQEGEIYVVVSRAGMGITRIRRCLEELTQFLEA